MAFTVAALQAGFGSWLLKKGGDALLKSFSKDEVNVRFEKCLKKASKDLKQKYPDAFGGDIGQYFQNENIKNELFKMLFTDAHIDINVLEEHIDFNTLPEGFLNDLINSIKLYASSDSKINTIISNKKIYDLVKDSQADIEEILLISKSTNTELILLRHKLNEVFRNKFSYDDFLSNYYSNLRTLISDVNFFGLGIEQNYKKPRINIKEIFVKPTFIYKRKADDNEQILRDYITEESHREYYTIGVEKLVKIPNHLVILGNPGAGKSLLIKAIIYSIINKDAQILPCDNLFDYIPIRIELRKYLSYKKINNKNLLNYIVHLLDFEYSLNYISVDDLREILYKEKVILLFDGLDEIFDISEKYNVKNDIINFTNTYKNKSIVTSRFVGYEDAKLDKSYLEFEMNDFSEQQIDEYVRKWYTVEEVNEERRNLELAEFDKVKGKISDELIKNPLLLSLIVILYRNNLRIPESKLEIYQSCTKTLVHKWDSMKELDFSVNQEILDAKETLLADLAFWQYKVLSNTPDKLTYSSALSTVTSSMMNRLKISEWSLARPVAESFLLYAEKRSIYFDNNFTHKTFLEYFTAFWIYSNCDKKYSVRKRDAIIDEFISNPFWYIVFELLLNMIDNEQSDGEIIDGIYQRQINRGWQTFQFLLSALPSMKNLTKGQIKKLFTAVVLKLLNSSQKSRSRHAEEDEYITKASVNGTYEALEQLMSNSEYREIYIDAALEIYDKYDKKKTRVFSLSNEMMFLKHKDIYEVFLKQDSSLDTIVKENDFSYLIYIFHLSDFDQTFEEILSYISKYGPNSFFVSPSPMFASWHYVALCQNFFTSIVSKGHLDKINFYLDELEKKGVDRNKIIKFSMRDRLTFVTSKQKMQELLIASEAEINMLTKAILILMFLSMFSMASYAPEEFDEDLSLDSIIDIEISETLKHILRKSHRNPHSVYKQVLNFVKKKIK